MIIKLTLCGLILLLFAVIVFTYYVNQEGFEELRKGTNMNIAGTISVSPPIGARTSAVPNKGSLLSSSAAVTSFAPNKASSLVRSPLVGESPLKSEAIIPQVSLSNTGYQAMALQQKSDLLKDIQKIIHNELLANRNVDSTMIQSQKGTGSSVGSIAVSQGNEYKKRSKPSNGNQCYDSEDSCEATDLSPYIRKDSIPCWGCSLDY